ncbi:MAG: MFS transporter [Betaproteobacteria bacterium]|nr:MFS transporter [Betaproteobacteria bacterium]
MSATRWRSPMVVLVCGSVILTFTLGIRHTFGLFLQPMSMDHGWGREVFGLGAALMNLLWGLSQPFTGMLADRFGAGRVLVIGAIIYAAGIVCMATAATPLMFVLGVGVLVGLGMSTTTFSVVFGAFGRNFPAEKHSMVLGVGSAAGSVGQFALLPLALGIITWQGWFSALLVLAVLAALVVPLSFGIYDRGYGSQPHAPGTSLSEALREAFAQRGFWLLTLGYFTCGFQIVFIGTHFPAFLLDRGLTAADGTIALALIGLFNILGSWGAGWLGSRFPRTYLLSGIYASRGLAIIALLSFPLTSWSVYAFGAVLGFGWLATVPLTTGVVAGMFGVKHLAMLSGLVFLSHQVGGFFGGWLGGYLFDATGSYNVVWMIAIGLSVTATLVNLPIDERPVGRHAAAA